MQHVEEQADGSEQEYPVSAPFVGKQAVGDREDDGGKQAKRATPSIQKGLHAGYGGVAFAKVWVVRSLWVNAPADVFLHQAIERDLEDRGAYVEKSHYGDGDGYDVDLAASADASEFGVRDVWASLGLAEEGLLLGASSVVRSHYCCFVDDAVALVLVALRCKPWGTRIDWRYRGLSVRQFGLVARNECALTGERRKCWWRGSR